jgi:hypothetical protein
MGKWRGPSRNDTDPVTGRPIHQSVIPTIPERVRPKHYMPPRHLAEPKAPRTRYAALSVLLGRRRALSAKLPMQRIDAAVGGLPPSAYRHRSWWANTRTSPQGRSWWRVGWRVEDVDFATAMVTFDRDPIPEPPPTVPGYAPHWLQVKVASTDVEGWVPGKVTGQNGETITIRLPASTVTYWSRFVARAEPSLKGLRAWVHPGQGIVQVVGDPGTMLSARALTVRPEKTAYPPIVLHPGQRPPGFGLTRQGFGDLEDTDRQRAMALIAEEVAWLLDTTGEIDLKDAIWSVGEYHFGGNGNEWLDDWEIQDRLLSMTQPLVSFGGGELVWEYFEQMSLLELGPDLCFFVFEPNEHHDWEWFVPVDPNDLVRIRELARMGYASGPTGWGDPSFPPERLTVYPPLEYEDILGDDTTDSEGG